MSLISLQYSFRSIYFYTSKALICNIAISIYSFDLNRLNKLAKIATYVLSRDKAQSNTHWEVGGNLIAL